MHRRPEQPHTIVSRISLYLLTWKMGCCSRIRRRRVSIAHRPDCQISLGLASHCSGCLRMTRWMHVAGVLGIKLLIGDDIVVRLIPDTRLVILVPLWLSTRATEMLGSAARPWFLPQQSQLMASIRNRCDALNLSDRKSNTEGGAN